MKMHEQTRRSVDDFATALMADRLRSSEVDLNDPEAVERFLEASRFGARLIENCSARAAENAKNAALAQARK